MEIAKRLCIYFKDILQRQNPTTKHEIQTALVEADKAYTELMDRLDELARSNVASAELKKLLPSLRIKAYSMIQKKVTGLTLLSEGLDMDSSERPNLEEAEPPVDDILANDTADDVPDNLHNVLREMMGDNSSTDMDSSKDSTQGLDDSVEEAGAAAGGSRPKYECARCKLACRTSASLYRHKETCEKTEYLYNCECGRLFATAHQLGGIKGDARRRRSQLYLN